MNTYTSLVTDLMGTKLRTPHNEEIGVLQNVMLNPSEGTIIFVFLCYANFIGKVHRHFAIPRKELAFISDNGASYFEIDEYRLKDASECSTTGGKESHKEGINHIYELHAEQELFETLIAV